MIHFIDLLRYNYHWLNIQARNNNHQIYQKAVKKKQEPQASG